MGIRPQHFAILVASFILGGFVTATAAWSAETGRLTVVLTGQAMPKSDFRTTTPSFSSAIAPLLEGDAVFTNFEATVAEKDEPNEKNTVHGSVISPPEALDALMGIGINLIAFSDNHAWDMDVPGVLNSLREADRRHLVHAGTGLTLKEAAAPAYLRTPHGTVALVAQASGLIADGAAATPTRPGVNELRVPGAFTPKAVAPNPEDAERVLSSIREAAKNSDLVVVYQHNHVYEMPFDEMFTKHMPERLVPPPWVKDWAHREIDAGADVIVMHGSPVVQAVEVYHGKPIFYDLGNFIFNMDHSADVKFAEADVWESVIATATFDGRNLRSIAFRPIVLNKEGRGDGRLFIQTRGMPAPATGSEAHEILADLAKSSGAFGTSVVIKGDMAEIKLK